MKFSRFLCASYCCVELQYCIYILSIFAMFYFKRCLFSDESSQSSFCNTTVTDLTGSTVNLIFDAADVAHSTMTNDCSCNITGHFELVNKDIRIENFDNNTCPSVSTSGLVRQVTTGCNNDICITKETNCSKRYSTNIWISKNVYNGYISLTEISSLNPPSFIWIQIVSKREYYHLFLYIRFALSGKKKI